MIINIIKYKIIKYFKSHQDQKAIYIYICIKFSTVAQEKYTS